MLIAFAVLGSLITFVYLHRIDAAIQFDPRESYLAWLLCLMTAVLLGGVLGPLIVMEWAWKAAYGK